AAALIAVAHRVRRARQAGPDGREPPVVHDEPDGPQRTIAARDLGKIPDEVSLQHVATIDRPPEQRIGLALIGADPLRALPVVLQPRAPALMIGEADRVVESEGESIPEPSLHADLQRVIRPPAAAP